MTIFFHNFGEPEPFRTNNEQIHMYGSFGSMFVFQHHLWRHRFIQIFLREQTSVPHLNINGQCPVCISQEIIYVVYCPTLQLLANSSHASIMKQWSQTNKNTEIMYCTFKKGFKVPEAFCSNCHTTELSLIIISESCNMSHLMFQ